jgi:hypothetical protein
LFLSRGTIGKATIGRSTKRNSIPLRPELPPPTSGPNS